VDANQEQAGDVTVVEPLNDYIDASNADDLKALLTGLAGTGRKIVLDLGRVNFVDSSGCGSLIAALPKIHAAGGEVKICEINPTVRTIFDIIRLQRLIDLYATRAQAVAAFAR
jgi:anti-sigma B factor antagonist